MSAQERLDYLLEEVTIRKHADATKEGTAWATGARGLRDFTPSVWEQMIGYIRGLGMNATADQIVSGMDYGDPATIAMIDQLAAGNPTLFTPQRVTTLKSWGTTTSYRWQDAGYETEPTLEEIQAELDLAALQAFASGLVQRVSAAINLATAANGASQESIKSAAIAEVNAV